jgi:hypothetical protein
MADERSAGFPIAGLAVVALVVSTAVLAPKGFELLRQAESEAARRGALPDQSIEARLWEDPFAALRRYNERVRELCEAASKRSPGSALCAASWPKTAHEFVQELQAAQKAAQAGRDDDEARSSRSTRLGRRDTVIVAVLPGGTLIGAEEARQRTRYALLAGLNAAGYTPLDSERMGLFKAGICPSLVDDCDSAAQQARERAPAAAGTAAATEAAYFDVVFESFISQGARSKDGSDRRVLVLWVDEKVLKRRWLSSIASVLAELMPAAIGNGPRLRIIGPTRSEGLLNAFRDLDLIAAEARRLAEAPLLPTDEQAAQRARQLDLFQRRWAVLLRARLVSPGATTPDRDVLAEAALPPGLSLEQAFDARFEALHADFLSKDLGDELKRSNPRGGFFFRTVGTDDALVDLLVGELRARGLGRGSQQRVALIGEWDLLYTRHFASELRTRLDCGGRADCLPVQLASYDYLRGIDGISIDNAARNARGGEAKAADRGGSAIEWPEGRDQRDYLRRLVELRLTADGGGIDAIGVIGNDVHDKLLVAQALRDAFPDRPLFTTDLDARMLHPRVTGYTRNLIVASSLPLALSDELQCGTPPFRDTYQTAVFLAARYAATPLRAEAPDGSDGIGCQGLNITDLERRIQDALAHPRLYEIGRAGMIELFRPGDSSTQDAAARDRHERRAYAVVAALGWLILWVAVFFGKPGPALRTIRRQLTGATPDADADVLCSRRSTIIVAGVQAAAFGYALGVVLELALPHGVGLRGCLLLAAAAAALFWAFVYPSTRWVAEFRAAPSGAASQRRAWELLALQVLLYLGAVAALWWLWVAPGIAATDVREPFLMLSGVSSWPSQLLRTLSLLLFAWFLDFAWCGLAAAADRVDRRYFGAAGAPVLPAAPRRSFFAVVRDASIWLWQPTVGTRNARGGIDGAALWAQYRNRLAGWQRLARIVFWLAVAIGAVWLLGSLLGGARPEIPARGAADRALFLATMIIAGLGLVALLVLVADATVLSWRFLWLLKAGRTEYPAATVERFAAELGPELRERAAAPVAAGYADRSQPPAGPPPYNSLLDDWIDVRLIADHSAATGHLILFPFVLLALMIVARSRLFDNWQIGGSLLVMFALFVLWSIAMAALLKQGAEHARRMALERMNQDHLWLKGAGAAYAPLADQFPRLIEQVRNLRRGAFAPLFEQPLVRALLVPLGGAGGVQLLDLLLFAR